MLTAEGIRYVRLALGMTTKQLGDSIYCTKQTISNVERGKSELVMTRYLLTNVLMEEFDKLPEGDETDFRCMCASRGILYNKC